MLGGWLLGGLGWGAAGLDGFVVGAAGAGASGAGTTGMGFRPELAGCGFGFSIGLDGAEGFFPVGSGERGGAESRGLAASAVRIDASVSLSIT